MFERIFASTPVVWNARFAVMRRSYLAGLPRCPETRQEIRERDLGCRRRRRGQPTGSAALRNPLLCFANPVQQIQWIEPTKPSPKATFGRLGNRRGPQNAFKRRQRSFIALRYLGAVTGLRFQFE